MAVRTKTSIPNIVSRKNGWLYYLRGDKEIALLTKDLRIAAAKKIELESALSFFGYASYKFRASQIIPAYFDSRYKELIGKAPGGKKIRQGTYDEIMNVWRLHLKRNFETCRLIEINEVRWNRYVKRAKVKDLANHRKVLLGFLNYCKQEGHLKIIPDLKIPVVKRRARKILTEDEIRLLLQKSSKKLLLYNSMYLFMAMRNSEIIFMEWSRINFEQNFLYLNELDVKTGKPRAMMLNPIVRALLLDTRQRQVSEGIKTPYVFPKRGDPKKSMIKTGLRKAWEFAIARCGWKVGYVTPHDLRATYEVFANKRADFTDAQREKFAGASISVQKKIYVNFRPDELSGLETVVQVSGIEEIIMSNWNRPGKLLNGKS